MENGICTIILNRPEKLNALQFPIVIEIIDAFESFAKDRTIRVVVLKGTGRAFCSGTQRELVEKLNKKYEISQIDFIQNLLPFLKILCGFSRKQLKNISDWLELDAKEKKILK